ncbi:hypothetical protein TNCV_4593071 [Trichonephila clavipes]|nr:hypothetical protein TNCV_4593071 [Trichonephila clavipes]
MGAIGDRPRNFEYWSRDVDDTQVWQPFSLNFHTSPTGGQSLDRFKVHRYLYTGQFQWHLGSKWALRVKKSGRTNFLIIIALTITDNAQQ